MTNNTLLGPNSNGIADVIALAASGGSTLSTVNDTNVTIVATGSPSIALVHPATLTMGWVGTLAETRGGTNQSTYATGDTLYASAANTLSKLTGNTTTTRNFLRQTGTGAASQAPVWDTILASDIPASSISTVNDTNVSITINGSPSIAVLASISINMGWVGTLAEGRGGTNQSTYATGDTLYASAANTLSKLSGNITTTRNFLRQTGTGAASQAPVWDTIQAADIPASTLSRVNDTNVTVTLNGSPSIALLAAVSMNMGWAGQLAETRGGTNQSTYATGDTLYASAANTLSKLTGNITTTRNFLRQTGTGAASQAPVWDTIVAADVPGSALSANNDTNITLTLTGSPSTALLAAVSISVGWAGTLAIARGGSGQATAPLALNAFITGATQDTSPDPAADYVGTADASASTGKKVLLGAVPLRQFMWNQSGGFTAGSTLYLALGTALSTEAQAQVGLPFGGTIKNLYVHADIAQGVGNTIAYTMRKNGADQSVTCTMSNATSASDTSNSFTFAAGDLITVKQVVSASTLSTRAGIAFEIDYTYN